MAIWMTKQNMTSLAAATVNGVADFSHGGYEVFGREDWKSWQVRMRLKLLLFAVQHWNRLLWLLVGLCVRHIFR